MEENTDLDKTKLLIDLSSPLPKRLPLTPLIPIPTSINQIAVSPTNNNPFDVVARQTISPRANDPFEFVFKTAFYGEIDGETNCIDYEESKISINSEDSELKVRSKEEKVLLVNSEYKDNTDVNQKDRIRNKFKDEVNQKTVLNVKSKYITDNEKHNIVVNVGLNQHDLNLNSSPITAGSFKAVFKNTKLPCDSMSSGIVENTEDPIRTHYSENVSILQSASQSLPLSEGDSLIKDSGDFSTEESLKAVIAKRVNKCIQKVLNNSVKSKFSKSNDSFKQITDNTSAKQMFNRRSLSYITLSTSSTKCDRLNKSCTDSGALDEIFNLENPELITPDSSVASCDVEPPSPLAGEVSKTEDIEEVFKEANKLARTFSKIAESFCKTTDSDNEDDLFSCKPRWSYADSSEDEEEKLRNDPALNIRVSRSMVQALTDSKTESPALKAFKTRNRRSLDIHEANSAEKETGMRRSNSVGARPVNKKVPVIPSIVSSVPVVIVNPEENPIKLKKKITKDSKRGPLRAIIPVQSMTKETLKHEGKLTSQDISPVRNQPSVPLETPHKDNSQLGMHPVASSTPNKSITGMPQLLTPAIEMPSNKRRSLDSTIESRKSRTPLIDEGSRKRSNSASSNIPAPVVPVKPFKGLSVTNSPLKPKSTSCLPRSSISSQVKVQHDNKTDKKPKPAPKSSFNPKALNEVKSKTARPGRIKGAVNTISNLVTGKGKKVAARDKENRFPI